MTVSNQLNSTTFARFSEVAARNTDPGMDILPLQLKQIVLSYLTTKEIEDTSEAVKKLSGRLSTEMSTVITKLLLMKRKEIVEENEYLAHTINLLDNANITIETQTRFLRFYCLVYRIINPHYITVSLIGDVTNMAGYINSHEANCEWNAYEVDLRGKNLSELPEILRLCERAPSINIAGSSLTIEEDKQLTKWASEKPGRTIIR